MNLTFLKKLAKLSAEIQIDEEDLKSYFDLKRQINERKEKIACAKKKVKFASSESEGESNIKHISHQPLISLSKYISCYDNQTIIQQQQQKRQLDEECKTFYNLAKTINTEQKKHLGSFLFASLLRANNKFDLKLIHTFLGLVPLRKLVLTDLLVHAWLNEEEFCETTTTAVILNLYRLLYFLSGCARHMRNADYDVRETTPINESSTEEKNDSSSGCGGKNDEPQNDDESDAGDHDDFENDFVGDYLVKYKSLTENSNALVESLMLTWIIRSLLIQVSLISAQLNAERIVDSFSNRFEVV